MRQVKSKKRRVGLLLGVILMLAGISSTVFATGGNSYTIELDRWGIDGDPVNNVQGINDALSWASTQGFDKIIFPNQVYVISENHYIRINNLADKSQEELERIRKEA